MKIDKNLSMWARKAAFPICCYQDPTEIHIAYRAPSGQNLEGQQHSCPGVHSWTLVCQAHEGGQGVGKEYDKVLSQVWGSVTSLKL